MRFNPASVHGVKKIPAWLCAEPKCYRYSKALRKAGLPFTATHILRHAALTEHYHTGKDLLSTAKVAGHSDLSSTQKYAKTRDEVLRDIQQRMDKKIGTFDND